MYNEQTIPIGKTLYPTTNTKLAATLLTLGVPFADPNAPPLTNIYTDERPYRPGVPGTITYHLSGQTSQGTRTSDLVQAYESGNADQELDSLVDEIVQENPDLGNRLRKLLPAALACYCRAVLENRERLLDLWRRAHPMVLVRKGEHSFTLVSRNASDATLHRCGIK